MKERTINKAAIALLVIGLAQMSGDLLQITWLKGIGAATMLSPAPKVFSAVRGLETYSTRFYLEWEDRDGRQQSRQITSEIYARLAGPYNRRNIYGAVLAYGPALSDDERARPMFEAVARYALCGEAPLLGELGFDPAEMAGPVRVRYEPLPGTDLGQLPLVLEAPCR